MGPDTLLAVALILVVAVRAMLSATFLDQPNLGSEPGRV
jgi:hypothetical protein